MPHALFNVFMMLYAVTAITVTALLWAGVYWRTAVNALLPLSALALIGCVVKLVWTLIG